MIKGKQLLSDYAALLDQKEKELIAQKREVRAFLKTDHNAKDTKKHIEALEEAEARMEDIMSSLLDLKESAHFRRATEKLCRRCEGLDRYTSHMNQVLSQDMEQKKKTKIDLVKNITFLFGLPISFFMVVKNGLFHNHATPEQAAGIGLAIGSGVLAVDKIKTAFNAVGKAVCWAAKKGGEAIKDSCIATKSFLFNKKAQFGQRAQTISRSAKKRAGKLLRKPDV